MRPIIFVDVDNTLYDLEGEVGALSYFLPLPFTFPEPPKHYETPWENWRYRHGGEIYGPGDDLCEAITHLKREDALEALGLLPGGDYKAAQKDSELARKLFEETARNVWWWLVQQVHELMWREPDFVEPYLGAEEAIKRLRKCAADLYLMTVRPNHPALYDPTPWVRRWFGDVKVMVFPSEKEKVSKAFALLHGDWLHCEADGLIIVDDNPRVFELAERGIRFYQRRMDFSWAWFSLTKPWSHQLPKNVVTAGKWKELAEKVLEVVG